MILHRFHGPRDATSLGVLQMASVFYMKTIIFIEILKGKCCSWRAWRRWPSKTALLTVFFPVGSISLCLLFPQMTSELCPTGLAPAGRTHPTKPCSLLWSMLLCPWPLSPVEAWHSLGLGSLYFPELLSPCVGAFLSAFCLPVKDSLQLTRYGWGSWQKQLMQHGLQSD